MLNNKKFVSDFEIVNEWIDSISPKTIDKYSSKKYLWKCSNCENQWAASPYNRIKNNTGCNKCAYKKASIKRLEYFLEKYGSIYDSSSIKNWDYERNIYNPRSLPTRTRVSPLYWICELNHRWSTKGGYGSRKVGCPYCTNKKVLKGFNDLLTTNPDVKDFWDYSKNDLEPTLYLSGSGKKVYWLCKNNHSSYSSIKNKLRNIEKCKECSHLRSYFEVQVRDYLKSSYPEINFLENTKPIENNGSKLELDFYIPELSIAFEIQDNSTHDRYFENTEYLFYGKRIIKKGPIYHENKRQLAKKQLNCDLFDIWEEDFKSSDFQKIIDLIILQRIESRSSEC